MDVCLHGPYSTFLQFLIAQMGAPLCSILPSQNDSNLTLSQLMPKTQASNWPHSEVSILLILLQLSCDSTSLSPDQASSLHLGEMEVD